MGELRQFLFHAGSAVTVALLGVAYFARIHHLAYFIVVQILGGVMQVSPAIVWFGFHSHFLILPFPFSYSHSLMLSVHRVARSGSSNGELVRQTTVIPPGQRMKILWAFMASSSSFLFYSIAGGSLWASGIHTHPWVTSWAQ